MQDYSTNTQAVVEQQEAASMKEKRLEMEVIIY